MNARVGGTAAHTLHATTTYHPPATAKPIKWFTVAIGMFRGPFEMDVGDGLQVISFPDVGCGAAVGL